jgi:3-phosphoshikimate 1-carboxyvinyltransferase
MGALGGNIEVNGLSRNSLQGDKKVLDILKQFENRSFAEMHDLEIDASQIPDLIPVLSVVASVSGGDTRIINAGRLRLKESDRIESTFDMLSSLGADIRMTEDGLLIRGKKKLNGGTIDAAGDHRIVMSAAVAASVCENPVTIIGAEAVNKSYPSFFEDLKSIGGSYHVV